MNTPEQVSVRTVTPKEAGFTLLEVLVALLVLTIGLLGLAALQASGTRYVHGSYLRSQAVIQAYDMADRIRANLPGVQAGAYTSLSGIPSSPPDCLGSTCSPGDMATFDLWQWNTANAALLPGGTGSVAIAANTGGCAVANCICTITVSWNEVESTGTVAKTFSTTFQPFSQP
jgi:type IV pilus assembly protein PilV